MKVKSALKAVALFLIAALADECLVQAYLQSNNVNAPIVTLPDNVDAAPVLNYPSNDVGSGGPTTSYSKGRDNPATSDGSGNNQAQAVVGPPMIRDENGFIISGSGMGIPVAFVDVPVERDANGNIINDNNGMGIPKAFIEVPVHRDANGNIIENPNVKGIPIQFDVPIPVKFDENGNFIAPVAGSSKSNIIASSRSS